MSGLFGIIDINNEIDVRNISKQIATALSHKDWFNHDIYLNEELNLAIGRVSIGVFNKSPQPVWNRSNTVALFMIGEIYSANSKSVKGNLLPVEQFLLELYESEGIDFVRHLNGVFCVAILDLNVKKLFLFNDRLGLYPHYYHSSPGRLIFSCEIKGILCDKTVPKKFDLVAIAQYIRFQRLLGTRTFFEDIHLLPYSSILFYDLKTGAFNVDHYWDFDQIPEWPIRATFQDAVDETSRLLNASISNCIQGDEKVGVYLSGGLDSRTILGIASSMRPGIPSLTYGVPNCWDAVYAQRIARKTKSPHTFIPIENGKWVADYVDYHLETTEGFITWTHSHAALTLSPARELLDVNLTGFYGDGLIGGRAFQVAPDILHAPDDIASVVQCFKYFSQSFAWPGINEGEERLLFQPEIFKKIQGLAFESLKTEFSKFSHIAIPNRFEYFTSINHSVRLTNMTEVFKQPYFEVRYPFCDNDLIDYVFSMPINYRISDKLYLAVINKIIPKLAWVPRDLNNQFLTTNKMINSFTKYWHKISRKIFTYQHPVDFEDPSGWLRNDLQDWLNSVLFSTSMKNHGLFDIKFLRSLYHRHMSGHESHYIVGKIAPVMTYELMMQRFYD
jgi:asparagine synthase (glutamine-hydrolysing)